MAEAIFEAALPRQAGDALPSSPAGVVVAVADRLDSLVGLCAAGCAPSASADPFGLRRAAYGMLQALVATRTPLSLSAAVRAAAGVQPIPVPDAVRGEVVEFVTRRLEQLLVDSGARAARVVGFGVGCVGKRGGGGESAGAALPRAGPDAAAPRQPPSNR